MLNLETNLLETGGYNVNAISKTSATVSTVGASARVETSNEFVGVNASLSRTVGPGISLNVDLEEGVKVNIGVSGILGGGVSIGITKY